MSRYLSIYLYINPNYLSNFLTIYLLLISISILSFGDDYNKSETIQFIVGDLVQVTGGELRSLVAKVLSVDNVTQTCKLMPYNNVLTTVMTVENSLLGI
jgi:transcription antitermination factor NusG